MLAGLRRPSLLGLPPLAALLCTVASVVIRVGTGGLRVDDRFPTSAVSLVTIALFVAALLLSLFFLWRTCLRPDAAPLELRQVRRAALLACLAAAPMLPMLSNDVFSVLAYGDLALRGIDPYAASTELFRSRFFGYVNPGWSTAPCVYGPVTLLLAVACVAGGQGSLPLSLALYKLVSLAACLALV